MSYYVTIGLEIHVEMKTESKMFSSAPVEYGALPNTLVSPVDVAFPGVLPTVNKQAVINAIRVCNALHMEIDNTLHFDRKNYFYPDLPKGFQITQDKRPIGKNGYIDLEVNGETHRVNIERLHLEEDTCKQLHYPDCTYLDYNRAGIPLIEIVTTPCVHSVEVAMKYVEAIREIVVYANVSDGKMEEGSLRCDVNLSLNHGENDALGNKVEVKNINSISNMGIAANYEINRQTEMLNNNETIIQETRRYDDSTKSTISMRSKVNAIDYRYFSECNIMPIKLSDAFIKDAIGTCQELASSKRNRYINEYKLSTYDCELLLQNKDVSEYFDECCKLTKNYKSLVNWIMGDITSYLNRVGVDIKKFPMNKKQLIEIITLIEDGKVSNTQGKKLFEHMLSSGDDVETSRKTLGIVDQVNDESAIYTWINEVLDANPQSIQDIKDGKDRAIGFLVGQVMKKSQGKANPGVTSKLIIEEINKR